MRYVCCLLLMTLARTAAGDSSPTPLVDRLDEIRAAESVPAFALVLVDRDGPVLATARGLADLDTERPVTPQTRFRIGSITKAFTGTALLIAESSGTLGLEDVVADLVETPPFANPWSDTHPLRLVHLLEHSAGFQDWVQDEWDLNDPLPLAAALAYRPESRTARWPPGLHSSYSNSGAGVAAWVFEQVSGQDFEDYVTKRVFAPLGMGTARFTPDAAVAASLATGYDADGVSVIPYWHVILRPAAAISLEPRDMAPFIRMLLNRGRVEGERLLTPAQVARLERPVSTLAAGAGLDYGYGLGIYQWQRDGYSLFGHGGDGDGYLAHFGYSPEAGRGYFVVINAFRHRPLRRMREAIEAWVLETLPSEPEPPPLAKDAPLAVYAGRYREVTSRFGKLPPEGTAEVVADSGRLRLRYDDGDEGTLLPVAPALFRRPRDTVATAAFVRDEDGTLYLQGPMGNYRRVATD